MGFDLSDYVTVAQRIAEFRAKHPEGSLQTQLIELPEAFASSFVAVEARAYRFLEDPNPGIDIAWEEVPGKTPYTRGSELMNASTSAVGRAIVNALAADTKKGIASADEIQARKSSEAPGVDNANSHGEDEMRSQTGDSDTGGGGAVSGDNPTPPSRFKYAPKNCPGHDDWKPGRSGWRFCGLCGTAEKGAA